MSVLQSLIRAMRMQIVPTLMALTAALASKDSLEMEQLVKVSLCN